MYELAILDTGAIQNGTQFPIGDTPKKFSCHKPTYLEGLSLNHIATIEGLQPYNGGTWARILMGISNPDIYGDFRPSLTPDISTKRRAKRPNGVEVEVELIATVPIQISVKNSTGVAISHPVKETLEKLVPDIRRTLTDFKSEF